MFHYAWEVEDLLLFHLLHGLFLRDTTVPQRDAWQERRYRTRILLALVLASQTNSQIVNYHFKTGERYSYLSGKPAFPSVVLVLMRIHSCLARKTTYHYILILFNEFSTAEALEVTIHVATQNLLLNAKYGIFVGISACNFFSPANRPMNSIDGI